MTASKRAWVALTFVAVLIVTCCGAALAAPPDAVPNSGVSHNCVATSSGALFSRANDGEHLGQLVRDVAPHGGQGEWVQGAVHSTC